MYPVRIWVKITSSHLLIFSLSIYLSIFDIILGWSLANQNGFIKIWILLFSFGIIFLICSDLQLNICPNPWFVLTRSRMIHANQIDPVKSDFNWYLFGLILFLFIIIFYKIDI